MSGPSKFAFMGSIPEVMFEMVPSDNVIINVYRKLPVFGACRMPEQLRKEIEMEHKPKRGAKRKGKTGPFDVVKNLKKRVKKTARKPRSPSPMV